MVNVCFQDATPEMKEFLRRLRTRVRVGVVGGSDLVKILEQLGDDGELVDRSQIHLMGSSV